MRSLNQTGTSWPAEQQGWADQHSSKAYGRGSLACLLLPPFAMPVCVWWQHRAAANYTALN